VVDKVGRVAGILQLLEDQEAILQDLEAQRDAVQQEIENLNINPPCPSQDQLALKEGSNPAEIQRGVQAFLQTIWTTPSDAASFGQWREQIVEIVQGIASNAAPIPTEEYEWCEEDGDGNDNDGGYEEIAFGDFGGEEQEQAVFPDAAPDDIMPVSTKRCLDEDADPKAVRQRITTRLANKSAESAASSSSVNPLAVHVCANAKGKGGQGQGKGAIDTR
jgi:hypothetical protein